MAKRKAKRLVRDFSPAEKAHWESAVAETEAEREMILKKGRAVLAAHRAATDMLKQLRSERERSGLSLADMMKLTGMSRESICRLENDPMPNPTIFTFARYADALGLELHFTAKPRG